jgi:hypothetical protein
MSDKNDPDYIYKKIGEKYGPLLREIIRVSREEKSIRRTMVQGDNESSSSTILKQKLIMLRDSI